MKKYKGCMDFMVYRVYGNALYYRDKLRKLVAQFDSKEDAEIFIKAMGNHSYNDFEILDNRED